MLLGLSPAAVAQATIVQRTGVLVTVPSPYWGYHYNPYGSYLHGAADVIRAQGQFLIYKQRASLLREEVKRAKLVTQKQALEHYEWERDFRVASLERDRERVRKAEVERSRNFPPVTEILSAAALNNLVGELGKHSSSAGASIRVEGEWLRHVNLSTPGITGNIALLKDPALFWPTFFSYRKTLAEQRESVEQALAQAWEKSFRGKVDVELVIELRRSIKLLRGEVRRAARADEGPITTPADLSKAYRFLDDLYAAVSVLERPDAAYYLNPLQGKTVTELVAYMKRNGLEFAPATTGSERFYVALHRALADELARLQQP